MTPIEWLEKNAPGFKELHTDERVAITQFAFLWSFFEAQILDTAASADAVVNVVGKWQERGAIDSERFALSLAYFRDRYFQQGEFTNHFAGQFGLELRRNDHSDLVMSVLSGTSDDPADSVAALLIVVYRLRNNLFHGTKWAYELRDQLSNFNHANAILINALDMHSCGPY